MAAQETPHEVNWLEHSGWLPRPPQTAGAQSGPPPGEPSVAEKQWALTIVQKEEYRRAALARIHNIRCDPPLIDRAGAT
jgi:hypothetical protein